MFGLQTPEGWEVVENNRNTIRIEKGCAHIECLTFNPPNDDPKNYHVGFVDTETLLGPAWGYEVGQEEMAAEKFKELVE